MHTTASLIIADVRAAIATIPDGSIDLVLTSPPFLGLRHYLPEGHPLKEQEFGIEPTPADYITGMLALSAEFRRVLAPHGSIAVELGDTYAGRGGKAHGRDRHRKPGREKPARLRGAGGWPPVKSLTLIPELYRVGLAYGIHPLTGEPSPAGSWRVRNVVRWGRPNPNPSADADKYRPATSDLVVACLSERRWFDLAAVRTPLTDPGHAQANGGRRRIASDEHFGRDPDVHEPNEVVVQNPDGAPPLDYWWLDPDEADELDAYPQDLWVVPTGSYPGSHSATWPPRLLVTPVLSMAPPRVCTTCGEPSRRIIAPPALDHYRTSTRTQTMRAVVMAEAAGLTDAHVQAIRAHGNTDAGKGKAAKTGAGRNSPEVTALAGEAKAALGGYFREFTMVPPNVPSTWSDCGHDTWRPGRVLDPFAGTGTTLAVATGHGRDAIGFDLDDRNEALAVERVGMLLTVYDLDGWTAASGMLAPHP